MHNRLQTWVNGTCGCVDYKHVGVALEVSRIHALIASSKASRHVLPCNRQNAAAPAAVVLIIDARVGVGVVADCYAVVAPLRRRFAPADAAQRQVRKCAVRAALKTKFRRRRV